MNYYRVMIFQKQLTPLERICGEHLLVISISCELFGDLSLTGSKSGSETEPSQQRVIIRYLTNRV